MMPCAPRSNGLDDAENERLALLSEECAEVIQIIGKIQRHGFDSKDPTNPQCPGNRALLEKKIAQVVQAVDLMAGAEDINQSRVGAHLRARWISVQKYLHHQVAELFQLGRLRL